LEQLANAREKIERAQQHIEDKRMATQQAISRLEKEYEHMAIERRETDKNNEELRAEADELERKVSHHLAPFLRRPLAQRIDVGLYHISSDPDGRASQTQ